MKKFDENLYSRQIFTYGIDTMDKIINLKILIIGLRGLGIEIAKNIILAGPKEISISDKNICQINDLGSNFYINEKDINKKTREESCINKLKSLNPYVIVKIHQDIYNEDIKKFNLIIITEMMKLEDLFYLNSICRNNNINFIYTLNLGLTGFLFNDFGNEHYIFDFNGEKKLTYNILTIKEKEEYYKIVLDIPENESFELKEGDYVVFKRVEGLAFLNDGQPKKIIKTNKTSFYIENKNKNNDKYISNGYIEEYKMPKKLKFNSFKDNFLIPNNNYINIDARKKNTNLLLHCSFIGLHLFYSNYNKIPELNNLQEVEEIVELSYNYYLIIKEQYNDCLKLKKKKVIEFNKNYIRNTLRWCKSELNPICAFLGGIVSQEALKITGKYMPIYQWLRFDFFEIIENIPNSINRNLLNCRYDDQIAIFGQEIQEKLMNLNIFMVGAGALGCEYIKNFALMGISCKNGVITVTDNDNIALSNLNRQFLFNINDVKENKSKSYCVRREAMKINKKMKIKDYQLLINEETRNIFDDDFMENQNVIISAVDNVDARKYIDNLCTFYNKILLDSGTEGTKANSDIYYPNKSTCLNDYPFIVKKQIPMCTLKDFPTKIEHCIEFSKNIFIELFTQYITDIKLTIDNLNQFENLLNQINDTNTLFLSIEIYKHIFNNINNPSKSSIIKFAIFIFKYYFDYNINKLLIEKKNSFEENITNKKPSSLTIDPNEENTILYFQSFYNIFSTILNFNQTISIEEIISIISEEKIIIKENTLSKEKLINEFNGEIIKKIEENENNIQEKIKSILPIKFEKDNDENYHINFILSFSNLRANNYKIEKTDFLKVKEVAGNIIPAIASTTAAISGLSCLQIYTILLTDNLNNFRNSNFNLATSIYDLSIPEEKRFITDTPKTQIANETKVIPKKFTVWDKIDLYGPFLNVKNIIDIFKKKYDVEIEFINYKNNVLASPIDGDEDYEKTIEELVKEINGENLMKKKYIKLEIFGSKCEADIITPTIRYILKK